MEVAVDLLAAVLVVLIGNASGNDEHEEFLTRLNPAAAVGHRQGRRARVVLIEVGENARLEIEAGVFFLWMRTEAAREGVRLRVSSGFRTFEQQSRLYRCFIECNCNACRRAARPGHSLHEAGRAIDLDVDDDRARAWLEKNARRFGFVRNVREERWHFEYVGDASVR